MASGAAVISFDCETGPKELIEDRQHGLLIPEGDIDRMAEAISMLIQNPEIREIYGKAAIKSTARFNYENILLEWDKIFDKFLAQR